MRALSQTGVLYQKEGEVSLLVHNRFNYHSHAFRSSARRDHHEVQCVIQVQCGFSSRECSAACAAGTAGQAGTQDVAA